MGAHWIVLLAPLLRYSYARDAYVLRVVGDRLGPVLKRERRDERRSRRAAARSGARIA